MSAGHYIETNKKAWNAKTPFHVDSVFYNHSEFLNGKNSLNAIELNILGDVTGKKMLHLQCHFGQDTLSLARLGADVTGVDFSDVAIDMAKKTTLELKLNAKFICCNLYDLPEFLNEEFDIVYTSYGTISWLPDLDRWAQIVCRFLKPGGRFVFVEFHPVVWMFSNDLTKIEYNYNKEEPIIEIEKGTYADADAPIETETISWNHSLSEVISSLLQKQLHLDFFKEYNYSPYNVFADMEEVSQGKFQVKAFGDKVPLVYALVAHK